MNIESYRPYLDNYLKKLTAINRRFVISIAVVLALAFGIFRACSYMGMAPPPIYRIARDPTWYPLQLFDKEKSMTAFSNELLMSIAKREKIGIELIQTSPTSLLEGLRNGSFDGVLSALLPSPINRDTYVFSDPIYIIGSVLIVRNKSNIKSIDDLEGKIVGIRTGSLATSLIQQYPGVILNPYDNVMTALLDLEKGSIDGVVMESLPAYVYLSKLYANSLKIAGSILTNQRIRLLVKRDSEHELQLIQKFNAGLKAMKEDGSYDALLDAWGLSNPANPK